MNTLTEIAYILDRSGSMQSMQEPAVSAFNEFLRDQIAVPGAARLTLVQFDDQYEVHVDAQPLAQVPQLTAATFQPRGSTALLDAIGRTIKETDRRLESLPPAEQPAKVIFAIFTDGMENASQRYTAQHISDLIALYRKEKGWEFLFLAANQDAIATAANMQMDVHLSANVQFTASGIKSTGRALSRKIKSIRRLAFDGDDTEALAEQAVSMDQMVREEEAKED
ncbi:MAG: VWA domain-containing protein [Verrucomicrobiaceae bacterium]|nr:VWA domain-containing protein [Verrucomicrobiaceae bacterium]